jgi:hypothetical protein
MSTELAYNSLHQLVVCKRCKTSVIPGRSSVERHLRAEPHRLLGQALKAHLVYTDSLALRTLEVLQGSKPANGGTQLEYLEVYNSYCCLLYEGDAFLTTYLPRIQHHMSSHKRKAKEHESTPLWKEYKLQTYFTAKGRIDYFIVADEENSGVKGTARGSMLVTEPEKELFEKLKRDYKDVKCDLKEQATIVQGIRDSRSERVPWLYDVTGFLYHNTTLKDEEIWSSYKLPPKKELNRGYENTKDPNLVRILIAAEAVLRDAYRLYSDTSLDRKMTQ